MKKLTAAAVALLTLAAIPAAASACGPYTSRIDRNERFVQQRLDLQRNRVRAGLRDGSLTRGEARRLRRGNQRLANQLSYARTNDGRVTRSERAMLVHKLDRQSNRIYRLRHNNVTQVAYRYDRRNKRQKRSQRFARNFR